MAISCVVEYPEDYCHERFYGITPAKRYVSMGYQGRSPWLVSLKAFSISKARLSSSPVFQTDNNNLYSYPGANASISANGTTNGIVWALQYKPPSQPSLLHAYNAANLKELYNSSMQAADAIKNVTVFTLPTIANGKVYLTAHYAKASGTVPLGKLYIFGLRP
jgi:hypothetical protein